MKNIISLKSQKGLELLFSLQHWAKHMLEMFAERYISIFTKFHFDST